jgi:hypothetical protein
VKIVFSEKDGPQKTLYYFSTNLADESSRNIALLQFTRTLGQGDSFVKSASYLMHNANFSQVRNFVLENSAVILQDDTGVPARMFDPAKWNLRPYGRYVQPIPIFQGMYQTKLAELYHRNPPRPIDFGVGYRWYPNESNLLLASREPLAPDVTASVATAAPPQRIESEPAPNTRQSVYRPPPPVPPRDQYYEPYPGRAYEPPPPPPPVAQAPYPYPGYGPAPLLYETHPGIRTVHRSLCAVAEAAGSVPVPLLAATTAVSATVVIAFVISVPVFVATRSE